MSTSTPRQRSAKAMGIVLNDTLGGQPEFVQIRPRASIREVLDAEAAKVGCSPNHCAKLLLEYALKALQDGRIRLVEPQWEGKNTK